ncbi:smoothelin-like protein 1 isoform X1 [Ahaetulla prasina]|uniref:smoothelin-like protein 1 isoform X1 n=2 Tax=Ahaetulla prasina TaxID=499056 RepID=UPI00264A0C55|nr:smoothelin-like protein 1 isoform X1 [Ahaetulla prasina]
MLEWSVNRPLTLHSIGTTEKPGIMETGDTKEQDKNQQINGLQQKSEMTQNAFEGESEAGKAETGEKETKEERKFAEETGKEVDDASEVEKAKMAAGNEVHGEKEAGETEAAGLEAKQKEESTEEASESEQGMASKASQKEKIVKDSSQPESEDVSETKYDVSEKPEDLQGEASKASQKEKIVKDSSQPESEGVSETKDDVSEKPEDLQGEASKASQKEKIVKDSSQPESEGVSETKDDVSEKPEDLQGEEGGKADVLKKNAKEEGQTGSTSDEPLSPDPEEEEEEFWPEFPPRSPEASPQSPTELKGLETGGIPPPTTTPEAAPAEITSPEAALKGEKEPLPAAPEEAAAAKEKKKRPAFDRREITRPRMPPRGQSRKAIVERFGGAATGPAPNIKKTGGANTVKTMLLEWCRAMTRGYEHVDIQNFSTSWKSGMAFCALIHKFFPDAFDYANLDPANRKENFTLAFSTAEKYADCAQLLEVEDMVRMSVPDNKCIYTYIQELYRSLVEKGLVKTKKK